jgi:hypothetical protein
VIVFVVLDVFCFFCFGGFGIGPTGRLLPFSSDAMMEEEEEEEEGFDGLPLERRTMWPGILTKRDRIDCVGTACER